MDLFTTVHHFAERRHLAAGVCDAARLDDLRTRLHSREVPFVSHNIEKRIDPAKTMPGVKSIVVLGVPYTVKRVHAEPDETHITRPYGLLSSLGTCEDYHRIVKENVQDLAAFLSREVQSAFRRKIIVDGGGLDERVLAVKAGIGFWGRSGAVISPVFGPLFNIGCLLTDLETIEMPKKLPGCLTSCPEGCSRCADACPGQAITPDGIDAARCVSYLTQREGVLTEPEMALLGQHLYGCDLCRQVCPFGEGRHPKDGCVPLEDMLSLDEAAFNARYGDTAMAWRGLDTLRRNALIVMGNRPADERHMSTAQVYLTHPNEAVAKAASYALRRAGLNQR